MLDGHLNFCKECVRIKARENRLKNIERYRAKESARAKTERGISCRLNYQKSERGKEVRRIATKKFRENHPEKFKANVAVNNAVRLGKLKRLPCVRCGSLKTQAHHEDYSKPLDVEWLCSRHHADRHLEIRNGK